MCVSGVVCFYLLAAGLLFAASALPLEVKSLLLCFLLREVRGWQTLAAQNRGELSLHIDGTCRYQGQEYNVVKRVFFSRYLIVLDIARNGENRRLVLSFDAFPPYAFRHLCRVYLALKV
ncbi:Protein of uncharacterised function (DUF1434) [Grimontia hollisae]|uniref:Protein of uncharacterized function (DUF1434) n=1 Tax=Grimontia hollisae TaxID=673 RepID=A0A377HK70_GRIHO|nr:Protein of uncharacterised function (DUF1434) [Grimontia hollisae]STO56484.1 Protein of uncharacterised function (DUF1434) [Grimontia hollisae]STQ77463.1 Protein of uncharacterised function (DUF1434) [Grimontia hollisae]